MSEHVSVHVVKYPDRDNLVMRYCCPISGKQVSRSTGTTRRKDAEKIAAKWEAEVREGRYRRDSRIGWQEFRELHEEQHLAELAPSTSATYVTALNTFERHCRPARLSDVTTARVSHFRTALRKTGIKPATVANYLRHLAAAVKWAHGQGLIAVLPECKPPKGARASDRMKGRPITAEEFDRMLAKVESVVRRAAAPDWTFYLQALWCSGLRLSESLTLTWDRRDDAISIDQSGGHAMLRIPAQVEKGKRDRLLPVTPDFAELLATIPPDQRTGKLFSVHQHPVNVSAVVSKIGRAAGVKVSDTKYASAHDFRRAFGTRWSRVLSPARLKVLMRHTDIATTMRYYVDDDAESLAAALYKGTNPGEVTFGVTQPREQGTLSDADPTKTGSFRAGDQGLEPRLMESENVKALQPKISLPAYCPGF